MNETTRRVLSEFKELQETRKRIQAEGLVDEKTIARMIQQEKNKKWEIADRLRLAQEQKDEIEKKRQAEEEKAIGKMAYRLERKMREAMRLKEEEEYRNMVEERYQEKLRKEREAKGEKVEEKKEDEIEGLKIETLTI